MQFIKSFFEKVSLNFHITELVTSLQMAHLFNCSRLSAFQQEINFAYFSVMMNAMAVDTARFGEADR